MKMLNEIIKEYIFENNTPSCHASTIVKTETGFIAAWFGGTFEGEDDVQIYVSINENDKWSIPKCVSAKEQVPHWNPVLFNNGDKVMLFYKRGKKISAWETMVMFSYDNGKSWTAPARLCEIDEGGRGPVKNKPLYLKNGTLVAPASVEIDQWKCFVDISYDKGDTWVKSSYVPAPDTGTNLIQPSLWEDDKGLHMLMRSNRQKVYKSDSADNGTSWCEAYPIDVPHNNSGLDMVKTESGLLVLVCNPVTARRTPLSVLVSYDNGGTFIKEITLEDTDGEFSYPSIIADSDMLYGVYTYKRKQIKFFKIKIG